MTLIRLYRQYLRQIKSLPVLYLRQFFRLKAIDDTWAVARTKDPVLSCRKLKRLRKDLRKLETASKGDVKAYAQILDLAYGRKGKLKWELMEPLLSSGTDRPPRIISSVERSRMPVYSPELRALLTSSLSRTTRPLKPDALDNPPTLPRRTPDEEKLIGTFSKRREVNIRWRYFTTEWKKIFPPLQTIVCGKGSEELPENDSASVAARVNGLQDVFQDVQRLVGSPWKARNLTRRELSSREPSLHLTGHHNSRWLRRRFQQLLGHIPILISTYSNSGLSKKRLTVTLSPSAISPSPRFTAERIPEATLADIEWFNIKPKSTK
ncbi:hypothetical protein AX15_001624 [Amanita polypyramis BW_CC]|nr:hypothetical protein AX15_001624 [Amanita polypyramis BW_CC]